MQKETDAQQQRDVLSERQEKLSVARRLLLEKRLRGQLKNKEWTIPRREQSGPAPLSFAQQRLWFLSQLMPDSPFYNVPIITRLRGPLHIALLQQAVDHIVKRHETLRTTFALLEQQPVQVIHPPSTTWLPVVDLSHLHPACQQATAQQLVTQEVKSPFDLTQGPLLRPLLLRLTDDEHILVLNMHHIITDAWSVRVFIDELRMLYAAFLDNQASPLPELPIQYADFASWQQQWLQGERLDNQLDYWRQKLSGASFILELPTDYPRPVAQSFRGAAIPFELPAELSQALKNLGRQTGNNLFNTLLTLFNLLLSRYTNQSDILVGIPIAGRHRSEVRGLIGFFVNTLVIRTQLSRHLSVQELLAQVRETTLEAYSNQDLPLELLVKDLLPERDPGRNPLFQVMFDFDEIMEDVTASADAAASAPDRTGLELGKNAGSHYLTETELDLETDSGTAKFDLSLAMLDTGQTLRGEIEFSTDLFTAATIQNMANHFQQLVAEAVANPQQPIWSLPLLTAAETDQVVYTWNETNHPYASSLCIHQLIEAQVIATPDRIALSFGEEQLTYGELDRRANQLAHYLRGLGVGPEMLVGVFLQRSISMVVALLGVLKAGGGYVPLDPTYPAERIRFILTDTQSPVLLTEKELADAWKNVINNVICLDEDGSTIAAMPVESLPTQCRAENLAYVIYTSGSTGKPKGVAITHQSALALISWAHRVFDETVLARTLAVTSICFDLSIFELFVPLSCGGTVVLVETVLDVPESDAAQTVSLINTVPSAMKELLRRQGLPDSVQVINLAGEILPTNLVQQIYQQQPAIHSVYDLYGPSEDTTYSTYARRDPSGPMIIGRPIDNTQVYILDGELQPVPVGVPGEVYIGGDGLARGYLRRAGLTAERFLPHPFSRTPGARLYRTGDLARYRPDGHIAFIGRIDHQVKVRGYRIELGEIEAVLRQQAAVQDVVVVARTLSGRETTAEKQLVAYVTAKPTAVLQVHALREALQAALPNYMVPAAFVLLDTLPMTPNGKVDRQALPNPREMSLIGQEDLVGPRTALEWRLVQIWEEVLDIQPVGITDDFFQLGGHSLMAVRLVARLQQEIHPTFPLTAVFQNATIELMAAALRQYNPDNLAAPTPLVPIQAGDHGRHPLFFVHPVGGNVFCYFDLARHLGPEQPFYGLQARGLDGSEEPSSNIEEMAAHYITSIRRVQPEGPYRLGGWSMGGLIALEIAQQLHAQGQEIAGLILIDTHQPTSTQTTDADLLVSFMQDLGLWNPIDNLGEVTQGAPEDELVYILQQAREAGVIPLDTQLTQIQHFFDVFKANVRAMEQYEPRLYAGSPVTLFKAVEFWGEGELESDLGWGKFIPHQLTVHDTPGHHFSLLHSPQVALLAELLKDSLWEAAR